MAVSFLYVYFIVKSADSSVGEGMGFFRTRKTYRSLRQVLRLLGYASARTN